MQTFTGQCHTPPLTETLAIDTSLTLQTSHSFSHSPILPVPQLLIHPLSLNQSLPTLLLPHAHPSTHSLSEDSPFLQPLKRNTKIHLQYYESPSLEPVMQTFNPIKVFAM